ncbi:MAG: DegT/DnrJ/EryC1/StrS family aminotransferase, partial [Bacteroidetes bacterium]|nr:DegT/DnrJ/EryC1/StrS family aminotransferase [Bacteroidota bacterium]
SLSLDFGLVKESITTKTKAVILPHIMGFVARDTEKLVAFCKEKGIALIEDCAQAIGAKLNGELVGNFGDAAIFSFEQSKTITCISGGMATCKSPEIAKHIGNIQKRCAFPELELTKQIMKTTIGLYNKFSSSLSEVKKPWIIAFNERHFIKTMQPCEIEFRPSTTAGLRMDSLTAGLLFFQLQKLKTVNELRNKTAAKWKKQLREKVEWFEPIENSQPAYLRLPFKVPSNEKQSGQWDYFKNYRLGKWYSTLQDPADVEIDGFPTAKKMCETVVNLPTLL